MGRLVNDYEKYKSLTVRRDWAGICRMNGVDMQSSRFGTMKEMNRLSEQLQSGEVVICFTAGVMTNTGDSNSTDFGISTWLVVLTDRRFLFLDAALLTKSLDVHSILHKNVQAVRVAQGFVLGKITIDTGGRSTVIDNCEKTTVKVLGDVANEWLQILEERKSAPKEPSSTPRESDLDKLKKLGELKNLGVLSEREFNDAKARIMASMQAEEKIIIRCTKCSQQCRVPKGKTLEIVCPKCHYSWMQST